MYEFTPFKKSYILKFNSFIQVLRELLERKEYKQLTPNAIFFYFSR